jgi:signal recognition particle receptor subunit beta
MVFFNYSTMQMAAKVVYYGPGLCGKTTNLHYIYGHTTVDSRGEMVSLETETDRTLFFDLLPLDVGSIAGFNTRIQLYTVPGQVFYNTTRKLVLKGVDGVVFVVDSQRAMLQANLDSFRNLEENLAEMGLSIESLPLVLQYNKRDLSEIYSVDELNQTINRQGWPHFEASAVAGQGVFETLKGISKYTLLALKRRLGRSGAEGAASPRLAPPGTGLAAAARAGGAPAVAAQAAAQAPAIPPAPQAPQTPQTPQTPQSVAARPQAATERDPQSSPHPRSPQAAAVDSPATYTPPGAVAAAAGVSRHSVLTPLPQFPPLPPLSSGASGASAATAASGTAEGSGAAALAAGAGGLNAVPAPPPTREAGSGAHPMTASAAVSQPAAPSAPGAAFATPTAAAPAAPSTLSDAAAPRKLSRGGTGKSRSVDVLSELEKLRREAMQPTSGHPVVSTTGSHAVRPHPPSAATPATAAAALALSPLGALGPSARAAGNGRAELSRNIEMTLKRADFARARRFLLSFQVEDEQHRIVDSVRDLQVEIKDTGDSTIEKLLLRLNIALHAKE